MNRANRITFSYQVTVLLAFLLVPVPLLSELISSALEKGNPTASETLFKQIGEEQSQITFKPEFPLSAGLDALQDQRSGIGVATGDYDGDGYPDIYVSNFNHGNRLYRNLKQWRFEDVTAQSGVYGAGRWCGGVTFVDIDNDHDLDLFAAAFNAPNLLYINHGKQGFQEAAREFGLGFNGASVMMAFADMDRDGDLDGYLVTARLALDNRQGLPKSANEALKRGLIRVRHTGKIDITPAYQELFATIPKPNGREELILAGQPDRLYRNDGHAGFRDVTQEYGIIGNDIGLAAAWWDYNSDGYPDLYVSNDYKGPDRLYRNKEGKGFEDVTKTALPATPYASMGADFADVNNDGHLDFLATDMAGSNRAREVMNYSDLARDLWFLASAEPRQYRRNMLYLNSGIDRFYEAAYFAGLEKTDWTWSPKFGDFDNDGWADLFIANGMSRDFVNRDTANQLGVKGDRGWIDTPLLLETNLVFRNLRGRFQEYGAEWGLNLNSASYGTALADFDRNGALDLVVANFNAPLALYRNSATTNASILVRLRGTKDNSWGIGARVTAWCGGERQTQELALARGFMSANEPVLHFGCGSASQIDRLQVLWPNGSSQEFENLEVDRFYTITQPNISGTNRPLSSTRTWFAASGHGTNLVHRENLHDDFSSQPLLPFKFSESGPGIALGDANGDKLEDIFLSGSAGHAGSLFIRRTDGGFELKPQRALEEHARREQLGALFFDADSDGDEDLYVVSGAAGPIGRSDLLRHSLYLNRGTADYFEAPPGTLPDLAFAGSVVCGADFDRDGDLDLFVGGRVVPARYPEAPRSALLRNDGARFVDITASGLRHPGMITSAIWSDVDNDGWVDLLLTREWGSIMLFKNLRGEQQDVSADAGLSGLTGLWNSIAGADLDNDGDMDYIVGNLGLNTVYSATVDRPLTLFHGDFEGMGRTDLLEAAYQGENLYPLRGKFLLTESLPSLFARYRTFNEFGRANVQDVFGDRFPNLRRLSVSCLSSGVLMNDGKGKFEFRPLPWPTQLAPVFGIYSADLNGDGFVDVYLSQNFSGARPETGRMRGGLGVLLEGIGSGEFSHVVPSRAGISVPEDGRSVIGLNLNHDQWPDLLVMVNQGAARAFINQPPTGRKLFSVELISTDAGNKKAIGARVQAIYSDGSSRTAEVYAGGGYLAQSTPTLPFSVPPGSSCRELNVRWPRGKEQRVEITSALDRIVVHER